MKEIDNKHYFEDALLTWKILNVIKVSHNLDLVNVYRHVRISGFEVDALAICETQEGIERWIGFELKESDINKAYSQAFLRRIYFDYFYIVINLRTQTIVDFLIRMSENERLEKSIEKTIGFVSSADNVVIYKSRFKKRVEIKNEEFKGRRIKATPLVKFLHEEMKE